MLPSQLHILLMAFTLIMKSQSIVYLLNESEHIYWILALKVKCTQYGICSQATLKNARAMFFLMLGKAGNNFKSVQKILGRAAPPRFDTPQSS